jgi:predicted phage terminase large subunit-like protein
MSLPIVNATVLDKLGPKELLKLHSLLSASLAHKAEASLFEFYRSFAWPAVEGDNLFLDNWHLQNMAEHLEAVTSGQIKRLVINVPFRTSKSTLVSVAWPAWVWLKDPGFQWLCGSYAEKLAIRDSLKMRRLITSAKFIAAFGNRITMTQDQNQKVRFENDQGGYRIAFGMTGGVMGDGGDCILLDDPHDRQGAHSEAERETALTTYDQALVTRLNKPATDPIVIIMQRLHQNDLCGHVLKEQGVWTHLMLPMRYERARACSTSIGFKDPRTKEGELLWPERFPEKTVQALETTLGVYGTAGQLQQRPSPQGGGILRTDKFRLWPAAKDLPDLLWVGQSLDTAFTEKTTGDQTAFTCWGIFEYEKKRHVLLLDAWAERLSYPKLLDKVIADWGAKYGGVKGDRMKPSRKADVILIEDKGSGQSLIQSLRAANVPVTPYAPGRSDKISRAHMIAPLLESGCLWVLESTKNLGKPRNWAAPFLDQLEQFPAGEHDDYVDTFTQMMWLLKDQGQLEQRSAPIEEPEELDYHQRHPRANPYG